MTKAREQMLRGFYEQTNKNFEELKIQVEKISVEKSNEILEEMAKIGDMKGEEIIKSLNEDMIKRGIITQEELDRQTPVKEWSEEELKEISNLPF